MLMIILGILKVIGILFLILLGIILLLILLLLFCPVRYTGAAEKAEGQQLRASGDITWLLHLLHLRVTVEGTQPEVSVRILGITPEGFGRFVSAFRRKAKTSNTDTDKSAGKKSETIKKNSYVDRDITAKDSTDVSQNETYSSEDASEAANHDEKCFEEGETVTDQNKKTDESARTDFPDKTEKIINQILSAGRKILGIIKKIFHLPERITKGINKGISQGKVVAKNASALKAFVSTQEFKEALTFGFGKMMRFVRHLRPRKLTGDVEFGFSDPADTGMVLAVIAPFFPYYADHLQVVPDFQNRKLSFSLSFKGRIYGCMLLYTAVQVLLDRNIRIVIGKIRKRRSE